MDRLPDSLMLRIFTQLSMTDLGKVSRVCQTWRRITHDPSIWRSVNLEKHARGMDDKSFQLLVKTRFGPALRHLNLANFAATSKMLQELAKSGIRKRLEIRLLQQRRGELPAKSTVARTEACSRGFRVFEANPKAFYHAQVSRHWQPLVERRCPSHVRQNAEPRHPGLHELRSHERRTRSDRRYVLPEIGIILFERVQEYLRNYLRGFAAKVHSPENTSASLHSDP